MRIGRRAFLASASIAALAGPVLGRVADLIPRIRAVPAPLQAVRLLPSPYLDAVSANMKVLMALDPGRLLHNFHKSAGLPVEGECYGGWEARGIAGHSLGHAMSALALIHAQTGDPAPRERLAGIVRELARIQAAHGDGYIGGTTVERDGKVVDGKIVFEELRRGDVRSSGFDVNGGWVPLYTWHKVQAGLIEAVRTARVAEAMPVLTGMAGYLGTIIEGLDDGQLQTLLKAEYGGLNEAYADLHALDGNPRWLALARRIRDARVLDPLAQQRNILPGLHANTQIPKLVGLARLYELIGEPGDAIAARFFHETVATHHSYVIGGNSDREHFTPPDRQADFITDRTCESCNSYNMLRLTRHLHGWRPDPALFDFYERVHLNHILAHQNPATGMFAYFMPLASGSRRTWSTTEDSFWCCYGSGLESHAKHGESIWWREDDALVANLFIPSTLDWQGWRVRMDTRYPESERIELIVEAAPRGGQTLALRLPGWCLAPALTVNGAPEPIGSDARQARVTRTWQSGDRIVLTLPMTVRMETTPGTSPRIAYCNGPMVLAADLGPSDQPYASPDPAIVAERPEQAVSRTDGRLVLAAARPAPLPMVPFYRQYDRRSAVYFPRFTAAEWQVEADAYAVKAEQSRLLATRTVDVLELGEQQPEQDHGFVTNQADLLSWGGRAGRQIWWGIGNFAEFDLAVAEGPMSLRALYWGEEVNKHFALLVDGREVAVERRADPSVSAFVSRDYPIPMELTRGKAKVRVRIETRGSDAPVYEMRMVRAEPR
ncbi:beta-L-arabinofuranosidase domain-containing protein [Sphingomonas sp. CJ99]